MDPKKIRAKHGPEYGIQARIVQYLYERGWHVERLMGGAMRGGAVQSGLPDLLICHKQYGIRFLEVKQEEHYRFTKAQKWKFPLLMANGGGIWILTEATEDQYQRLFKTPNLWDYLDPKDCYAKESIDQLLEELNESSTPE